MHLGVRFGRMIAPPCECSPIQGGNLGAGHVDPGESSFPGAEGNEGLVKTTTLLIISKHA